MKAAPFKVVTIAALGALGLLTSSCATTGDFAPPRDLTIAGSRIFPESITADNLGNIIVGSNPGTIYRARSGDAQAVPWIVPNAANGLQQVFGVFADDAHSALWVCSNPAQGAPGPSMLKRFDLATGELRASYPFSGTGPALCNDIAVASDGRVYATETIGGRIVTLSPSGSALELYADSPDMRGIDGIAIAGDGTLYVNNVIKNLLQRVERGVGGGFGSLVLIQTSLPLSGPDGLRTLGGNRFLQAEGPGGRVTLLTIEGDRAQMLPIATGINYPASMVLVGRTVFVPEGKIDYMLDPAKRNLDPGPFFIRAVTLDKLP